MARGQRPENRTNRSTRSKPAPEGWGTMGSLTARRATPGSPARSRALVRPEGDRDTPGDDALLHVRDPSLDARAQVKVAAGAASATAGPDSSPPRLGRRAFLGALGGGALAVAAAAGGGRRRGLLRLGEPPARRRPRCRSARRLPIPPELTRRRARDPDPRGRGADPARAARRRIWTYGGSFPGPTIRRPAGQRTEVTFTTSCPPRSAS